MTLPGCDEFIIRSDLRDTARLPKEDFVNSLCYFISEVTKKKIGELYPGATLYQLVVAIQKYLKLHKFSWNLIYGEDFTQVRNVLDNVMKERVEQNIGMNKKQAKLITYDMENNLWQRGYLGTDTPEKSTDPS